VWPLQAAIQGDFLRLAILWRMERHQSLLERPPQQKVLASLEVSLFGLINRKVKGFD
jgi:hypothetical protein